MCPGNFVRQIDRNLLGKQIKNLQKAAPKLFKKKKKLQINQSVCRRNSATK